ncbi:MAG: flagellar filament capping protein FliD [Dyella sp.]
MSVSSISNTTAPSTSTGTSSSTGTATAPGSGSALPNPGQGLLSSAGIGSGLDVTAIVAALVNAQQAGPQAQINAQTQQDQDTLAGLAGLGTSLSQLQSALGELTSSSTFTTFNATLSTTALGTVSTLPDAVPGTFDINVTALAQAQKRLSGPQAAGSPVGEGTLTVAVGSKSLNISVSATDSLTDIATAINNASNNPGVSATVVNGSSGAQLVLTSTSTGVANGFTVSADATSSSSLISLATTLNTPGSNEASDAQLSIDGVAVTSASNAVSGALTGVTLNLAATGTSQLTVSQNTDTVNTAVQDFVSAFNGLVGVVGQLTSFDPTTGASGVLLGDSSLASLQRQISSVLGGTVSGNSIGSLAALGITRAADGTLSVDSATLSSALSSNPEAVQNLFGGSNGIATQLATVAGNFNGPGGIIASRTSSLNTAITGLQAQTAALSARMAVFQQQLTTQFTNLDTLISSLNNTSSFLTQSLATLNNNNNNKN